MTENDLIAQALAMILAETNHPVYGNALDELWKEQQATLASATATKAEKEQAKRVMDSLAKGLPAIANGLRDAVKGFQSGDPFAGSAAVMEICAALSSTIGALSVAGGPPGAVVGALFSIVAMILKMFTKPQKSLTAQLEEIVRTIKSESKIQKLHTAQQAIEALIDTLTTVGEKWTLAEIEAKLNPIDGAAINAIREAGQWLEEPKNQDLPLWGHVLAAQCQTYISFMEAQTLAIASIDIAGIEDKGVLSIAKLSAAFASNHPIQLRFLLRVQPAARNRGLKWHIGRFSTGRFLESGALNLSDATTGGWKSLGGEMRVVTVSKTRTNNRLDANPYLAIFHLEQADTPFQRPEFSNRYRKNNRTYAMFGKWPLDRNTGWKEIGELQGLYDICATPGAKENEVYVYTATGKKIEKWVHSADHTGTGLARSPDFDFYVAADHTARAVCAVSRPVAPSGEDPNFIAGEEWVVYGGCEGPNKETFINVQFSSGYRGQIRMGIMYGMAADSRYLWTFSKVDITCISHNLMFQLVRRRLKDIFQEQAYYSIPPELKMTGVDESFDGLLDLAPCDDGTLTAVFRKDGKRIYKATPKVSLAKEWVTQSSFLRQIVIKGEKKDDYGRIIPTNGWERSTGEEANRVAKQPIFCWSLVEGLTKALQKSQEVRAATV